MCGVMLNSKMWGISESVTVRSVFEIVKCSRLRSVKHVGRKSDDDSVKSVGY